VRHVFAIAGRELRSLFASPVAYVVLTLFSVLAGFFFLTGVLQFQEYVIRMQTFQLSEQLAELNLNDHVIAPFLHVMSVVLLFLIPGLTMGLFASEKANGTQELLLTSPIKIWELVIGKFLGSSRCWSRCLRSTRRCSSGTGIRSSARRSRASARSSWWGSPTRRSAPSPRR